jgi:hypothetical protein
MWNTAATDRVAYLVNGGGTVITQINLAFYAVERRALVDTLVAFAERLDLVGWRNMAEQCSNAQGYK